MNTGRVRTEFDPAAGSVYRLLNSVVVPRPIAWVSSTSPAGVDNLAPHSFFTVSSVTPPVVQFTSVGEKDTLRNVRATGEFVVNLASEALFEVVNETATDFPPEIGEFDAAGVAREPSATVRPPRVAGSPVALECRVHDIIAVGDCFVVMGEVLLIAIDADVLVDGHPAVERLRPLARLGRDEWSTIGEVREIKRRRYGDG
jgi:flavin reductase (DIM6/NTAB) family NADH-FMN oxidoreductase RutF